MTMVFTLPDDLRERLRFYAKSQGVNEEIALVELIKMLPAPAEFASENSGLAKSRISPPFPGLVTYTAPNFDDELPDEFWFGVSPNDDVLHK